MIKAERAIKLLELSSLFIAGFSHLFLRLSAPGFSKNEKPKKGEVFVLFIVGAIFGLERTSENEV